MTFTLATTTEAALEAIGAGARPIAGGTDLVVGARQSKAPLPDKLVAIDRIAELGALEESPDGLRIGATVTHARLMADPLVIQNATALADAAALVGGPSTRNVGTLGGNIMNASPAMDSGAPLMVLGASVEFQSLEGTRTVDIADLWTGPGATVAAATELCTAVTFPKPSPETGSAYVRLEYRRAMEIAIVGAAATVMLDASGNVAMARLALTAVAPTIVEVDDIAHLCVGRPPDDVLLAMVATAASERAEPISDLRAGAAYRRHCVGVMAGRAFGAAARRAAGHQISVPVNRAEGIGAPS